MDLSSRVQKHQQFILAQSHNDQLDDGKKRIQMEKFDKLNIAKPHFGPEDPDV